MEKSHKLHQQRLKISWSIWEPLDERCEKILHRNSKSILFPFEVLPPNISLKIVHSI